MIPTALHVAAVLAHRARPAAGARAICTTLLRRRRDEFDDVIKIGRTHLMDATPIRLGQEFGGYASQVEHAIARVEAMLPDLRELAIGGTAVGTGLNTHPEFGARMAAELTRLDRARRSARRANHFEAQGAQDGARLGERRAQQRRREPDEDRERHPAA